MMELSQASGRNAAMLPTDSHAHSGANEANPHPKNQPLRKKARRICAWVGGLVALAGIGAPAQQQTPNAPIGDVYESGGAPIYSDTYESSCESGNTSPYKGMNPLVCYGVTGSPDLSGKCSNTGPTVSLWKQEGNLCIYCQHLNPPLTDGFVVPIDEVKATETQGYTCGVNQTDPSCSAVCTGPGGIGKFKPPPGTKLEGTPAVPQQPNVMPSKQPQQTEFGDGTFDPSCFNLKLIGKPEFTPDQVSLLRKDVAGARAMVRMAKKFTDQIPWNEKTQAISEKYYGNATYETQTLIRQDINNVLNVLNNITDVTKGLYPSGADFHGTPTSAGYIAYVPRGTGSTTQIFLGDSFWKLPLTGQYSQAMVLVHEASHLPLGASTEDFAYGQSGCEYLVYLTTDSDARALPGWEQLKLTDTAPPLRETAPLENADTFRLFVYDVAGQK